jgi:hypothetical protein
MSAGSAARASWLSGAAYHSMMRSFARSLNPRRLLLREAGVTAASVNPQHTGRRLPLYPE